MHGTDNTPSQEHGKPQSCEDQRTRHGERQQKPAPRHPRRCPRLSAHRLLIQAQQAVAAPPELSKSRFEADEIGAATTSKSRLRSRVNRHLRRRQFRLSQKSIEELIIRITVT